MHMYICKDKVVNLLLHDISHDIRKKISLYMNITDTFQSRLNNEKILGNLGHSFLKKKKKKCPNDSLSLNTSIILTSLDNICYFEKR